MFVFDEQVAGVRVAFTNRHGGVSAGPWESLNLGTGGGDDPMRVVANLRSVAEVFGVDPAQLVLMRQLHGAEVARVDTVPDVAPEADGLVTRSPGLVLVARAADCAPVVLADPLAGVVGVAHAGRRGVAAGVVPAVVAAARELGAGDGLRAWVGPRVCGACYEVPEAMRADVTAIEPATWAVSSRGTPALDVGAGVRAQLERLGVGYVDVADQVGTAAACTVESAALFSARRQGERSGRLAGLVQVRA